jgi:predicted ferric reductase
MVFAFHKAMAAFAGFLLMAHPLLMAWAKHRLSLLYRWDAPWPIHVGRLALFLLVTAVFLSAFRKAIRLEYERWRAWHNVLVVSVLVVGFVHSSSMSGLRAWPMRLVWSGLFGMAAIAYGYHRFYSLFRGLRRPFEIVWI